MKVKRYFIISIEKLQNTEHIKCRWDGLIYFNLMFKLKTHLLYTNIKILKTMQQLRLKHWRKFYETRLFINRKVSQVISPNFQRIFLRSCSIRPFFRSNGLPAGIRILWYFLRSILANKLQTGTFSVPLFYDLPG